MSIVGIVEIAERWYDKLVRVVPDEGLTVHELAHIYFGHEPSEQEIAFVRPLLILLEREGKMKPIYKAGQERWVIV